MFGYQLGELHQMLLAEFGLCTAAMWQWRNGAEFSPLGQQFVDVPFLNAEHFGNFGNGATLMINGINDSLA
jgi:hypothetical protein